MDGNSNLDHVIKVIEACLLTSNSTISSSQLVDIFDKNIPQSVIERLIFNLQQKYKDSGIELISVAGGYRFRSRLEYQTYINKLYSIKPPKYSRSVMEILAIIAYKQPVTRGDIEEIRGVAVNSNAIQALNERGWIEVIGHKQVPGKPELLATTNKLLEDLGISSLQDLPQLAADAEHETKETHDLIEEYDYNKTEAVANGE